MIKIKCLAIFDFDNTITTKDTLRDFIKYYSGKNNYYIGLIYCSWTILLYLLKIIKNQKAKEKIFEYFLKIIH